MLLVAVSLSAVRTLDVDIISTSAPFLAVCSIFRCSVQHFLGALDDEEFFIIEGSM